jgi:hypothetical protein
VSTPVLSELREQRPSRWGHAARSDRQRCERCDVVSEWFVRARSGARWGADDIDMVIDRAGFLVGGHTRTFDERAATREACGQVFFNAILEMVRRAVAVMSWRPSEPIQALRRHAGCSSC